MVRTEDADADEAGVDAVGASKGRSCFPSLLPSSFLSLLFLLPMKCSLYYSHFRDIGESNLVDLDSVGRTLPLFDLRHLAC